MPRTDIYLKVVVDHDQSETPEKLASEISRQVLKIYAVRKVELSSYLTHHED